MWCEDRRNGLIIADFAVQGTLAREVLGSPAEVMTRAGVKVPFARRPPQPPRNRAHIAMLQLRPSCRIGTLSDSAVPADANSMLVSTS